MSTESHRLNEGIKKLIYSLVPGLAIFFALFQLPINTRLIIAWDVFSVVLLLFYWTVFFKTDDKKLPRIVATEDDGVKIIFSIVLVAVCVSFLGVILLYQVQDNSKYKFLQAFISLSAIVCSWILLHTIFTTRYADLYFKDRRQWGHDDHTEALMFPSPEKPDYLDFAYFSFVIGMTFQVSDVQINSKMIRRFVLLHSLISFAFNTVIVAITINVIVNLGK